MLPANQQLSPIPLHQGEEHIRAQKVWLLVDVMFLTWGFFYLYLWLRGYSAAASICQIQALCYVVIRTLMRKKQRFLTVMNSYLVCSALGVFFVATSSPKLGMTIFFFPVSILVASYLSGLRQASYWFGASLLHFLAYFCYEYGFYETLTNHCDALALSMGTAVCTFFCCQQAEASYQSQTKGLLDFSKLLQHRSDELERLATTDSLTGLINRFQFQNELEEAVEFATEEEKVALFLLDMDGFKEVNDTLGHATGDEVLIEIGNRLSECFGDRARTARLGGDEFCVLFDGIHGIEAAEEIAKEAVAVLTRRYEAGENEVTLGTSVGYAFCPDHAQTGKHLSLIHI